jgi:replication fork clamp-binding protein CrfC
MAAIIDIKTLYESNYLQWLEETIKCLKNRQLADVDYENLIEELEDLAKKEKRRVRSLLEQIIRHLLLSQYWDLEKPRNANHWAAEIISFRNQLNEDLSVNLRNHLEDNFSIIYSNALDYVKAKTNLTNLPELCPYTLEQILDKNWLP